MVNLISLLRVFEITCVTLSQSHCVTSSLMRFDLPKQVFKSEWLFQDGGNHFF